MYVYVCVYIYIYKTTIEKIAREFCSYHSSCFLAGRDFPKTIPFWLRTFQVKYPQTWKISEDMPVYLVLGHQNVVNLA